MRRTLGRIFAINFRKGIVRFDPLRQLLRIEILRTRRHPEREPENGRAVATGRLFETNATLRSSLRSHDIPLRPCRNQFDTGLARQTFLRIGQPATDRIALRHGIRFHDKRIANRHRHRIRTHSQRIGRRNHPRGVPFPKTDLRRVDPPQSFQFRGQQNQVAYRTAEVTLPAVDPPHLQLPGLFPSTDLLRRYRIGHPLPDPGENLFFVITKFDTQTPHDLPQRVDRAQLLFRRAGFRLFQQRVQLRKPTFSDQIRRIFPPIGSSGAGNQRSQQHRTKKLEQIHSETVYIFTKLRILPANGNKKPPGNRNRAARRGMRITIKIR